jgi:ribose transport system permease protein
MLGIGFVGGVLNATLIVRLRIVAFIATLGMLNFGRGFGLWVTETRAMNLPDPFLQFGASRVVGVPVPLWLLAGVVVVAWVVLNRTPFGRQLYAVGHSLDAARKAGVNVNRLLVAAYVICGVCAGIGGVVALAQLGAVSPKFGEFYEFDAITAAVLGGTSLFGGRGNVFPGPIFGAVLVKSIFNGLVMLRADPYLFPLITSSIIFLAVLLDCLRSRWLERLNRRRIYVEPT